MEEEKEFRPQHKLLDACIKLAGVKTDRALSEKIGVASTVMSRIRHKKLPVTPTTILAIHEKLGMSVPEIRQLIEES